MVLHGFGQILAVTARIQCRTEQVGQPGQQVGANLLLLFKRHIAQLHYKRHPQAQILLAHERHDGGFVAAAGKVHADKAVPCLVQAVQQRLQAARKPVGHFGGAAVFRLQGEVVCLAVPQHGGIRRHTALNQRAVKPLAAAVFGDAVQLFRRVLAVAGADFRHPCALGFGRPLFAQAQADALVQAVRQRIVKGNAVDGIRFFARAAVVNQLIKRVVHAVMRGNDVDLAAPHQQGHRRFEQLRQIVMERGLVQNHTPLFTAQVVRARRQGGDAEAAGKTDDERQYCLLVVAIDKHFFALFHLACRQAVKLGPVAAVVDKFKRHVFVVADVPHIHAVCLRRQKCTVRRFAPRKADTARFFAHFDGVGVGNPALLIRQKHHRGAVGRHHVAIPKICLRMCSAVSSDSPPFFTARATSSAAACALARVLA